MPIPGARYRFKKMGKNKSVRLAFKGKQVVEVTSFHKKGGILKKHKVIWRKR